MSGASCSNQAQQPDEPSKLGAGQDIAERIIKTLERVIAKIAARKGEEDPGGA